MNTGNDYKYKKAKIADISTLAFKNIQTVSRVLCLDFHRDFYHLSTAKFALSL